MDELYLNEIDRLRALLRQRDRQLEGERKESQRVQSENERLRKALEEITQHRVNHFLTRDAMVASMFKTAKEALQNG